MADISAEDRKKIIELLSALIPKVKIYLFGSRARGTHSPYSDIDLAVDAGEKLSLVALDEAKSIIDASNIIYQVDIVDLSNISEDMRSSIMEEGVAWTH